MLQKSTTLFWFICTTDTVSLKLLGQWALWSLADVCAMLPVPSQHLNANCWEQLSSKAVLWGCSTPREVEQFWLWREVYTELWDKNNKKKVFNCQNSLSRFLWLEYNRWERELVQTCFLNSCVLQQEKKMMRNCCFFLEVGARCNAFSFSFSLCFNASHLASCFVFLLIAWPFILPVPL